MGKHYRERIEQEKAVNRNRWIKRAAVVSGGLVLTAVAFVATKDSGESLPKEVADAQAEFSDKYDCFAKDKIRVEKGSASDFLENPSGVEGTGYAFTDDNKITLAPDLFRQDLRPTMIHEMVHACADSKLVPFDPVDINQGLQATGSQGFEVWFSDSNAEQPNTFGGIEEGFAEWVATDFARVMGSNQPGYFATRELTEGLARVSGLNREQGISMHQSGDLVGYVAALSCVAKADVTSERMASYIFAFNDALATGEVAPVSALSDC